MFASLPMLGAGESLNLGSLVDLYGLGIMVKSGSSSLPLVSCLGGVLAVCVLMIVTARVFVSMCVSHCVLLGSCVCVCVCVC